jgi:hypothetical protein
MTSYDMLHVNGTNSIQLSQDMAYKCSLSVRQEIFVLRNTRKFFDCLFNNWFSKDLRINFRPSPK